MMVDSLELVVMEIWNDNQLDDRVVEARDRPEPLGVGSGATQGGMRCDGW